MLTRGLVLSSVVSLMLHTGVLVTYSNITSDKLGDNVDDIIEITFVSKESSIADSVLDKSSTAVKKKSKKIDENIDYKIDKNKDVSEIAKEVIDKEVEKQSSDGKEIEENISEEEVIEQLSENLDKVDPSANTSNSIDSQKASQDTVMTKSDEGYYIPKPEYPNLARKRSYEGVSRFRIILDDNLEVEDIILLSSSGYNILDRAARKSIENGKYNIKKKELEIAIRFSLDDL